MRARLAVVLLLAAGCKPASPERATAAAGSLLPPSAIEDPETCAPCHGRVVEEWQASMHARAHATQDPIFGKIRTVRTKREGPETPKKCASCHSPRQPDQPDGALAQRGVTCAACHAVAEVTPNARGHRALVATAPGVLLGPHDTEAVAHGGGPAPAHMKDGNSLCLACHGTLRNPADVPICTTGAEHASAGGKQTCVSCHMPERKGPAGAVGGADGRTTHRSHRFIGPRGAWNDAEALAFLRTGVTFRARLDADGLRVDLGNRSGHAFPSGFPGRMAAVVVKGYDAAGQAVWTPRPVPLRKLYVDATGKPTLAPYAKALKADSRLTPNERRPLRFADVPPAVVRTEAKLMFRLLAPPLTRKLGLGADPLGGARLVATATAAR